jgi:predicted  nucleic acid-binding Zn-ribbon protein
MAASTCIKCGNGSFQMVEQEPHGSRFKYMYHQCSRCGGVVGVSEYFNVGVLVKKVMAFFKINDN